MSLLHFSTCKSAPFFPRTGLSAGSVYNDKFTIEKTYGIYSKEQKEIRERRRNEIKNMSERDRIIMLSDINDTTHIMSKDDYIPINIPNKE